MQVSGLDAGGRLLKVEERPATRGTRDELRPRGAQPRALKNPVAEVEGASGIPEKGRGERDRVTDPVAQQRSEVGRGGEEERLAAQQASMASAQHEGKVAGAAGRKTRSDEARVVHKASTTGRRLIGKREEESRPGGLTRSVEDPVQERRQLRAARLERPFQGNGNA